MNATFPAVKRTDTGYNKAQVLAFLEKARVAYDNDIAGAVGLTSSEIRQTSFATEKGGFSSRHVDLALERLETAFAERERAIALATTGEAAWLEKSRQRAEELTARFSRAPKHRFDRVGFFVPGYSVKDVDAFCEKVVAYLTKGEALTLAQVRHATFVSSRGGYNEVQVDAVLDALVDLMLSVGQS